MSLNSVHRQSYFEFPVGTTLAIDQSHPADSSSASTNPPPEKKTALGRKRNFVVLEETAAPKTRKRKIDSSATSPITPPLKFSNKKYIFGRLLGAGTHGEVIEASLQKQPFAIKKSLKKEKSEKEEWLVTMLNRSGAEPIVKFYHGFNEIKGDTTIYFSVYERLDRVLSDFMYPIMTITTARQIYSIVLQLMGALLVLKKHGVIHGDLTTNNVGIKLDANQNLLVRLIDFGNSIKEPKFQKNYNHLMTTATYRAPELNLNRVDPEIKSVKTLEELNPYKKRYEDTISYGVDMWGLGCIALEIYSGRFLEWKTDPGLTAGLKHKKFSSSEETILSLALAVDLVGEIPENMWEGSWIKKIIKKEYLTPKEVFDRIGARIQWRLADKSPLIESIIRQALKMDPADRLQAENGMKELIYC